MIFYALVKDVIKTEFMQAADVFESFKFVGTVIEAKRNESVDDLRAYFQTLQKTDTKEFQIVAIFIPNIGSAVLSNHKVYSTGTRWITIEDLAKGYGACPIEEIKLQA